MVELPRLLSDFTPAHGLIKADYTDFVVEEIPLYPADGTGSHTYFLLEKAGLTTPQAVHDIARELNVRRHEIGFAGLKDSKAITRQWMSVEHVDPERLAKLDLARLRILETTRHRNKLRLGHLKGNAFTIKVRQTEPQRLAELQDALAELTRRGVPNYFGSQRFGYRGDSWAIGQAIVRRQIDAAVALVVGRPTPEDYGDILQARQLYERGEYLLAARAWPAVFHTERRVLKSLAQSGGNPRRGFGAIDRTTRTFYVSAYQSYLFNQVMTARLPAGLDQLWEGDLAWLHASGAVFRVENVEVEQPRADTFDISPTGPLFGYRMTEPTGRPGDLEASILAAEGLSPDAFHQAPLHVKGARRPLRFRPDDARLSLGADERGPYLELRFVLPRGCYATALLREFFRLETPQAAEPGNDEETEAAPP